MARRERFWSGPPVSRQDLRKFAWLMAGVLAAASGLLGYRGAGGAWPWTAAAAIALAGLGTLWPSGLRPLHAGWMALARALGYVNSHLILALVFYLLFTPLGLIMRLVRRDPLERGGFRPTGPACRPGAGQADGRAPGPDGVASLWHHRPETLLPRDHFERQF
ncbi:MAG: SxtJ family membrane protein [Gemmatimonadota bacterium]